MNINPERIWEGALEKLKTWARINSPWAIHYNSGSCNGCDIEILATLTPRYDLERVGVKLQGSPRHADILICTGPVTLQSRERLKRIYEQMPEPKFVVAVGSCAISGGAFQGCYNIVGHVDAVIPVDAYIPGCPPRPEAIIDGVVKLLESLKNADGRRQSTDNRAQSTDNRAQSTDNRAQNTDDRAQSTDNRAQNTDDRAQTADAGQ